MASSDEFSRHLPEFQDGSRDLLAGLNEAQRRAVCHVDGPLLILAGPGSGKTRVITHRIAHMIRQGVSPHHIVGLTFTNKAAGEMRRRLEQLIGPSQVWLGTFHGFCARLLRRYARLVGLPENFNIYDTEDAMGCLKTAVKTSQADLSHTPIATLAQRISYFKNRLITSELLRSEALSSHEYLVAQVYPFYQQALLRNGAVDFDDLLMHIALILREYPELREQLDQRFQYLLVDEYQDTNLAQYVILRHLSVSYPNLAATGDPDQSIYGWRGASLSNVANLERDYSDLQIIRLEQNYRSTPEILSIADCLIQNNAYRKHKQLLPARSSGCGVRLTIYPTARAEAEDVAEQIATLVHAGENRLGDFGILYRTNAQSRLIEQAMLKRQLPYQLIGGYRFYLRKEIKDLIGYLLLAYNPADDVALQRVINVPPRGIGKQTVQKIQELAQARRYSLLEACRIAVDEDALSTRAGKALRDFLSTVDAISRKLCDSLVSLVETTIELTGYREYLNANSSKGQDDVEIQQNIDELLVEAQELDADSTDSRPAIERFLEYAALQSDTDRLEVGKETVTLMTLHAAKGLEFPCVYLIAVEENILPHVRSKDDPMQIEEERRLLFVGITRAKDRLQLSYAKSRGFGSSADSGIPSSFLMELPRHEMSVQDRCEWQFDEPYEADSDPSDYSDMASDHYDEACQIDPADEVAAEWDDDCQLPAEERSQRLVRRAKQASGKILSPASQLDKLAVPWGRFCAGAKVLHPQLGSGEVLAASGHGPKRTVTVRFFDSSAERTFRLSHATLRLQDE